MLRCCCASYLIRMDAQQPPPAAARAVAVYVLQQGPNLARRSSRCGRWVCALHALRTWLQAAVYCGKAHPRGVPAVWAGLPRAVLLCKHSVLPRCACVWLRSPGAGCRHHCCMRAHPCRLPLPLLAQPHYADCLQHPPVTKPRFGLAPRAECSCCHGPSQHLWQTSQHRAGCAAAAAAPALAPALPQPILPSPQWCAGYVGAAPKQATAPAPLACSPCLAHPQERTGSLHLTQVVKCRRTPRMQGQRRRCACCSRRCLRSGECLLHCSAARVRGHRPQSCWVTRSGALRCGAARAATARSCARCWRQRAIPPPLRSHRCARGASSGHRSCCCRRRRRRCRRVPHCGRARRRWPEGAPRCHHRCPLTGDATALLLPASWAALA